MGNTTEGMGRMAGETAEGAGIGLDVDVEKRQYRRERDDIKRGHWKVTEPLTPDEENELQ